MYNPSFSFNSFNPFLISDIYIQNISANISANNASDTTTSTNFIYTYPRTIRVKYLRVLLSSFGEEDIQKFALICYMFKLSFYYYFAGNVGGATI